MRRESRPSLDALLSLLRDGDWHSIDQIATQLDVPRERLLVALHFLSEYSLLEFEEGRNVRITARVKKWLMELHGAGD